MKGTIPAPQKAPVQSVNGMTGDVTLKLGNLEVAWGVETVEMPAGEQSLEATISYGKTFSVVPKRLVCQYGNANMIISSGWDSEATTTTFKAYIYAPTAISASRNVRVMWLAWVG